MLSLQEFRKYTVEEEYAKMTQLGHFGPSPFRACVHDFQLPQAIFAFFGNWLIPNKKMFRVVR